MDERTLIAYLIIAAMVAGLALLIARLRYLSPARRNERADTRHRTEERAHRDAMDAKDEPPEPR